MEHNQKISIEPLNVFTRKFGIDNQNEFIVLDDAKHVIGVDPSNGDQLLFQNVQNGKAGKFKLNQSSYNLITTLVYDRKTEFLYSGDNKGHLYKCKINTNSKSCKIVKEYGNIGINWIISSHRFLHFVFLEVLVVKSESWICRLASFFRGI